MSTRLAAAYTKIGELVDGRQSATDGSVGDRTKLLLLSYRLFREDPLLGVGMRGWNEAVARLAMAPDPSDRVTIPYNQAHNQYADDLAKGGIVRFLLGFLVLFAAALPVLEMRALRGPRGQRIRAGRHRALGRLHDLLPERIPDDPPPHQHGPDEPGILPAGGVRLRCARTSAAPGAGSRDAMGKAACAQPAA